MSDTPWDVSFHYRSVAEKNDCNYLRVLQIDGETVWGSPIWVGQEPEQRAANSGR